MALVACLNHHNGPRGDLYVSLEYEGDNAVFVVGSSGLQVTWVALLDYRDAVLPAVYDYYGPESGGFSRPPVPRQIIAAFGACGADYRGTIPISVDEWIEEMNGERGVSLLTIRRHRPSIRWNP